MGAQHPVDKGDACRVGGVGVFSAFQHTRVPALEAEREDIEGDVGASLINHAYYPERHAHPLQVQAIVEGLVLQDSSERRRQGADVSHIRCNVPEPLLRELQSVVERVRLVHLGQVKGVGLQQRWSLGNDGISHRPENLVAFVVCQQREGLARRLHLLESLFQFQFHVTIPFFLRL